MLLIFFNLRLKVRMLKWVPVGLTVTAPPFFPGTHCPSPAYWSSVQAPPSPEPSLLSNTLCSDPLSPHHSFHQVVSVMCHLLNLPDPKSRLSSFVSVTVIRIFDSNILKMQPLSKDIMKWLEIYVGSILLSF